MTCTPTVVSYFEAHPQETESGRRQSVYSRTVYNFVHLCFPLNTECIQYRSLLITSFMLIIRPRRRGLCACNTVKKVDYKSQRLAYISVLHTAENSHGLFSNFYLSTLLFYKTPCCLVCINVTVVHRVFISNMLGTRRYCETS
jgi:hypothetical protein